MCLIGKNSVSLKDKANCIGLVDEGKSLLRMLAFRTELAEIADPASFDGSQIRRRLTGRRSGVV